MKNPWVFFREAKRESGAQGGSTGEDDFYDEAADDAAAEEGEAELGEEDSEDEEAESEDDDEQAQAQDDEEEEEAEEDEEEEVEELEEEEEAPAFKFKDAKSGDFDFKKINRVLGGDELEKTFKEQNATITRTFQELKSYKDLGVPPQELKARSVRAEFLDKMYNEDPGIRREVNRVLGISEDGGETSRGQIQLPEGVDPRDPLAQPLIQALQQVQAISNRLTMEDRRKQHDATEQRFASALNQGRARFKELTGKELTPEQASLVDQEMRQSGYADAAKLIPGLFFKEIQDAAAERLQKQRMVKKNLPKNSSRGKSPVPGKAKRRSKEEEFDELWKQAMNEED